jgi:hypothetical protein
LDLKDVQFDRRDYGPAWARYRAACVLPRSRESAGDADVRYAGIWGRSAGPRRVLRRQSSQHWAATDLSQSRSPHRPPVGAQPIERQPRPAKRRNTRRNDCRGWTSAHDSDPPNWFSQVRRDLAVHACGGCRCGWAYPLLGLANAEARVGRQSFAPLAGVHKQDPQSSSAIAPLGSVPLGYDEHSVRTTGAIGKSDNVPLVRVQFRDSIPRFWGEGRNSAR